MSMLILTRKPNERVMIGDDVIVQILDMKGNIVRLGFTAPENVIIHREEIFERIKQETPFHKPCDIRFKRTHPFNIRDIAMTKIH